MTINEMIDYYQQELQKAIASNDSEQIRLVQNWLRILSTKEQGKSYGHGQHEWNMLLRWRCTSFNTLLCLPWRWKDAFPFLGNRTTDGHGDKFCLDCLLAKRNHGNGMNARKSRMTQRIVLERERIDHFRLACFLEPWNQWSCLDWTIIKCNFALEWFVCRTKSKEKHFTPHSDNTMRLAIQLCSTQANIKLWIEDDPRF